MEAGEWLMMPSNCDFVSVSAFDLASLTPCRFRFARDWGRYSSSRIQLFSPNGAAGAPRGPSPANAPALDPRPALSKHGCSLELGTWNLELGTWNLELGTWNLELPASAGLALPCLSEACASIEILLENQHLACDRCSRNVRLT